MSTKGLNTQTATRLNYNINIIFPWLKTLAWIRGKVCVKYDFSVHIFDFRVWVSLYDILENDWFFFILADAILEFRESVWHVQKGHLLTNIYLCKFNSKSTRCEICLKLTTKAPERRQWRRFGVFIVNFENIPHLFLVYCWPWASKC